MGIALPCCGRAWVNNSDDNNVMATQEGKQWQQWQWHHFTVRTVAVDNSCHCWYLGGWGGVLLTALQCSCSNFWRRNCGSPWWQKQQMARDNEQAAASLLPISGKWQSTAAASNRESSGNDMVLPFHGSAYVVLAVVASQQLFLAKSPAMPCCQQWQLKSNNLLVEQSTSGIINRRQQNQQLQHQYRKLWHQPLQQFKNWSRLTIDWWGWQNRQQVETRV